MYVVSPSDLTLGRTVDSLSLDSLFTEPVAWRIEAQTYTSVEKVAHLRYGVVPLGYKQSVPADGSAPRAIVAGKRSFQRIDARVVRSQINLPCLQASNGKQITVPCAAH